jgi:ribosomal-protein-alanine N-acetyltransferase
MSDLDLHLIPARAEHANIWMQWRSDPVAVMHNPYEPLPLEALQETLRQAGHNLANESLTLYRWIVCAQDDLVGMVSLHSVSWVHRHAEIGYQIAAEHHGKGVGKAAVKLLVEKAFAESSMQRLTAFISTENEASLKLAQRLGFVHEGTLRKYFLIQNRWVDEAVYALLKSDWDALAD